MAKAKELKQEEKEQQTGFVVQFPELAPLGDGYVSRRVDMTLTPKQAEIANRLAGTLRSSGVTMASGKYVTTAEHAIRWMLEFLGECEEASSAPVDGAA